MSSILYVDNREPTKKIYDFFRLDRSFDKANQLRYKIAYTRIEKGDYIYNNVMIHRKTVPDFDNSYDNEHIKQEMYDLHLWVGQDLDRVGHLIIIGDSDWFNPHLQWSNIERLGAVASLEAQFGIPITFVKTELDFVILCHALFRKYEPSEDFRHIRPFDVFRYKSKEMRALPFEERFFKLFPDIDKVRSRILGTLPDLNIRVYVGDQPLNYFHLDNLEGIGSKTIEKIFIILDSLGYNGNVRQTKETNIEKAEI